MALFSNFGALKEKAAEAAQSAARTAKETAAKAKAKVDILAEEDKIRKAQLELGKLYYRDFAEGTSPVTEEYLPWCEKITEAKNNIEAIKASVEFPKPEKVEEEVNDLVDEIVADAQDTAAEAEKDLSDIKVEVVDDVKEAAEEIKDAVENVVEDVKDAIDDAQQ